MFGHISYLGCGLMEGAVGNTQLNFSAFSSRGD